VLQTELRLDRRPGLGLVAERNRIGIGLDFDRDREPAAAALAQQERRIDRRVGVTAGGP
jgi:hypothetical protein